MNEETLIIHVDVDAFFASVEQLLIPSLRGRPVIVGSGVIASCSYEAREFGLRAGMPLGKARRLCPQVVVLPGDQNIYRCFADGVWEVCRRFTCGLETYLDEAYGDASGMQAVHGEPAALGRKLQEQVRREVGLPVSVGLGSNRMMAKVASHAAKPGRVVWIRPGREEAFLEHLPVARLPGVGSKTEARLLDMNINTAGEMRALSRSMLFSMFGRHGEVLYERCRGRDVQELRPGALPRTISRETTFHQPTTDAGEVRGMLFYLLERAMRATRGAGLEARCVELSIRYDDWKGYAARRTLPAATDAEEEAFAVVEELLDRLHTRRVALRHVGVVLSGFARKGETGELFDQPKALQGRRQLHHAVDAIRDRYGHSAVVAGESIQLLGRLQRSDYGFVLRTPSLTK